MMKLLGSINESNTAGNIFAHNYLMHLCIEDLLLEQDAVSKKKVGKLCMKLKNGVIFDPIRVNYCIHTGKHSVCDGHHRLVAKYFLGFPTVLGIVDPCIYFGCQGEYEQVLYMHIKNIRLE